MSNKIRPIAKIEKNRDADGWHEWDEIEYYCPKCNRHLRGYGIEVGCPDCQIFFDWGDKVPEIVTVKSVAWG